MKPGETTSDLCLVFRNAGPRTRPTANINFEDFRPVGHSGAYISTHDIRLSNSRTPFQPPSRNFDPYALGEWLTVSKHAGKDEFLVTADPFGYMSTFVYLHTHSDNTVDVYVASTARSLAATLRSAGIEVEIDWETAQMHLASDHVWSLTTLGKETTLSQAFTLAPGELLHITKRSTSVIASTFHTPPSEPTYQELLARGISRAANQLVQIAGTSDLRTEYSCSGGKDSRTLMALLAASGVQKRFSLRSVDPEKWPNKSARAGLTRDLQITEVIRRRYGMDWAEPKPLHYSSIDFYESLNIWQEFRGSWNYSFTPTNVFAEQPEPLIELRGAAGETFRQYDGGYFSSIHDYDSRAYDPEQFDSLSSETFKIIMDLPSLSNEGSERALSKWKHLLRSTQGLNFAQAHGRLWSINRSRAHFGHVRHSLLYGTLPLFPLSQPEFVWASELLTQEDRALGRVAFDIIEMVDPGLNDIELESGKWPARFRQDKQTRIGATAPTLPSLPIPGFEKFKKLQDIARTDSHRNMRRMRETTVLSSSEVQKLAASELTQSIEELATLSTPDWLGFEHMRQQIMQRSQRSAARLYQLIAKAHSLRDLIAPPPMSNVQEFWLSIGNERIDSKITAAKRQFEDRPPSLRRKLHHIATSLLFNHNDGQVEAVIKVQESCSTSLEYAFYLLNDGKRVATQWYSPSNTFKLPLEDIPSTGLNSIQYFTRYAGEPSKPSIGMFQLPNIDAN